MTSDEQLSEKVSKFALSANAQEFIPGRVGYAPDVCGIMFELSNNQCGHKCGVTDETTTSPVRESRGESGVLSADAPAFIPAAAYMNSQPTVVKIENTDSLGGKTKAKGKVEAPTPETASKEAAKGYANARGSMPQDGKQSYVLSHRPHDGSKQNKNNSPNDGPYVKSGSAMAVDLPIAGSRSNYGLYRGSRNSHRAAGSSYRCSNSRQVYVSQGQASRGGEGAHNIPDTETGLVKEVPDSYEKSLAHQVEPEEGVKIVSDNVPPTGENVVLDENRENFSKIDKPNAHLETIIENVQDSPIQPVDDKAANAISEKTDNSGKVVDSCPTGKRETKTPTGSKEAKIDASGTPADGKSAAKDQKGGWRYHTGGGRSNRHVNNRQRGVHYGAAQRGGDRTNVMPYRYASDRGGKGEDRVPQQNGVTPGGYRRNRRGGNQNTKSGFSSSGNAKASQKFDAQPGDCSLKVVKGGDNQSASMVEADLNDEVLFPSISCIPAEQQAIAPRVSYRDCVLKKKTLNEEMGEADKMDASEGEASNATDEKCEADLSMETTTATRASELRDDFVRQADECETHSVEDGAKEYSATCPDGEGKFESVADCREDSSSESEMSTEVDGDSGVVVEPAAALGNDDQLSGVITGPRAEGEDDAGIDSSLDDGLNEPVDMPEELECVKEDVELVAVKVEQCQDGEESEKRLIESPETIEDSDFVHEAAPCVEPSAPKAEEMECDGVIEDAPGAERENEVSPRSMDVGESDTVCETPEKSVEGNGDVPEKIDGEGPAVNVQSISTDMSRKAISLEQEINMLNYMDMNDNSDVRFGDFLRNGAPGAACIEKTMRIYSASRILGVLRHVMPSLGSASSSKLYCAELRKVGSGSKVGQKDAHSGWKAHGWNKTDRKDVKLLRPESSSTGASGSGADMEEAARENANLKNGGGLFRRAGRGEEGAKKKAELFSPNRGSKTGTSPAKNTETIMDDWRNQMITEGVGESYPDIDMTWNNQQKLEKKDEALLMKRKLHSLLNKLTVDNFQVIYESLINSNIETPTDVTVLMSLIFEKATAQHHYIPMYVELCKRLKEDLQPILEQYGDQGDWRRILIDQCQDSFIAALKPLEMPEDIPDDEKLSFKIKYKGRMKGNMIFVGELLKAKILASRIIFNCIDGLLMQRAVAVSQNLEIEQSSLYLEVLASFLQTIGPYFDHPKWKAYKIFDERMSEITKLSLDKSVEFRVRCLLMDVLDNRAASWPNSGCGIREKPTKLSPSPNSGIDEGSRSCTAPPERGGIRLDSSKSSRTFFAKSSGNAADSLSPKVVSQPSSLVGELPMGSHSAVRNARSSAPVSNESKSAGACAGEASNDKKLDASLGKHDFAGLKPHPMLHLYKSAVGRIMSGRSAYEGDSEESNSRDFSETKSSERVPLDDQQKFIMTEVLLELIHKSGSQSKTNLRNKAIDFLLGEIVKEEWNKSRVCQAVEYLVTKKDGYSPLDDIRTDVPYADKILRQFTDALKNFGLCNNETHHMLCSKLV